MHPFLLLLPPSASSRGGGPAPAARGGKPGVLGTSLLSAILGLLLVHAIRFPTDPDKKDPCDDRLLPRGMLGGIDPYLQVGYFSDFKMASWTYLQR